MNIHDIKLQYEIEKQSALMQERICNRSMVSFIVPNSMNKMRNNY